MSSRPVSQRACGELNVRFKMKLLDSSYSVFFIAFGTLELPQCPEVMTLFTENLYRLPHIMLLYATFT